jgi:hypothetical protein
LSLGKSGLIRAHRRPACAVFTRGKQVTLTLDASASVEGTVAWRNVLTLSKAPLERQQRLTEDKVQVEP